MVIAKEDPGKVFAFFPIERLLTKGLAKVYREDPAIFLNIAELYLDPSKLAHIKEKSLTNLVNQLVFQQLDDGNFLSCTVKKKTKIGPDCVGKPEFKARVLKDLFSSCYQGQWDPNNNKNGEQDCLLEHTPPTKINNGDPTPTPENELREIRRVKDTIAGLSLNTIRVVASGIMTINVELIPAVLTKIQFDDPVQGTKPIWEDTDSKHTGVIYGKYLTNGKPLISSIKLALGSNATVGDYIDETSLAAVQEKSTDSELHFVVQFKKSIPNGSTLTFQVSRGSRKSTNDAGTANTQETTTSMALDYPVTYTPSSSSPSTKLTVTDLVFDPQADLLKPGKVIGHFVGTNLDGATIAIKSIKLENGTSGDRDTYVTGVSPENVSGTNDSILNFSLSLKKGLPPSAKVIFELTKKGADGASQTAESKPFSVPPK